MKGFDTFVVFVDFWVGHPGRSIQPAWLLACFSVAVPETKSNISLMGKATAETSQEPVLALSVFSSVALPSEENVTFCYWDCHSEASQEPVLALAGFPVSLPNEFL